MKKRKIFWRIFTSFLAVGCISLIAYFLIVLIYLNNIDLEAVRDKTDIYYFFIRNLGFTMLAMVSVMAIVSFYLGKRIARPFVFLEQKTKQAIETQSTEGDFVFYDYRTEEVASLAKWIGELHSHLNNRINKVTTQKNEQEAIFMSLSEGVIALSSDMKIKRMNTKAKRYFALEDRFKKDLGFCEAIRIPELTEFVKLVLGAREPAEMELELKEPKERILKVTSAPYLNAASEQLGVVLVFSDITKIKKLERHRTEFVANVSHELRTPLTSIQGYAETLLNPKVQAVPEKQQEFAEKIKDNSVRLKNMIDDLLYLANLDQRRDTEEEFLTDWVDMGFCAKRAMEYVKAKALSMNKKIEYYSEDAVKVKVNEGLFGQVLINLLDNALKYSGDAENIEFRFYRKEDQSLRILVKDNGIGISKEDLDRLFERFYRVDKDRSRLTGGSGLGLSIVKNILDLHRIEILVRSELNVGTEVELIVPAECVR